MMLRKSLAALLFASAAAMPMLAAPSNASAQSSWTPSADDLGNSGKVGLVFEGEWTTNAGRLRLSRDGAGDIDLFKGELWTGNAPAAAYLFEDLLPDSNGGMSGVWRPSGSSERRPVYFSLNRTDGDRFVAGMDGWAGGELTGRRGYDGPIPPNKPAPRPSSPVPSTPARQEQAPIPQVPSAPAADGFKPVGKFDVRLDRVVAEGRYWHVYLTLRNAASHSLVQAQGVDVRLEDSDGIGVESGQAVRARPGPPELFGSPPPTTRPGGTLPVKFVFDKREGADPMRILVLEGEHEAVFRLG
ncbi:hypothetical protein D3C87_274790 [compost metagenome]